VVEPPLVGEAGLGVEAAAIFEGLCQGTSRPGRLLPHTAQDLLAGILAPGRLRFWFFEVDHARNAHEEAAAFGASYEHGLLSKGPTVRDRMPVAHKARPRGGEENREVYPTLQARRR
jgi:hypothetical protein